MSEIGVLNKTVGELGRLLINFVLVCVILNYFSHVIFI